MSRHVKCDVKGCNTTDKVKSAMDGLPPGWRQIVEMRLEIPEPYRPAKSLDAARAMGVAVAEKLGIPSELADAALAIPELPAMSGYAVMVTLDMCPFHELPDMVQPDGAPQVAPMHTQASGNAA